MGYIHLFEPVDESDVGAYIDSLPAACTLECIDQTQFLESIVRHILSKLALNHIIPSASCRYNMDDAFPTSTMAPDWDETGWGISNIGRQFSMPHEESFRTSNLGFFDVTTQPTAHLQIGINLFPAKVRPRLEQSSQLKAQATVSSAASSYSLDGSSVFSSKTGARLAGKSTTASSIIDTLDGQQHKCGDCDRSFGSTATLKSHARNHTPEHLRPFGCAICQKRFIFGKDLKRHELVHGACEYQCMPCNKAFRRTDHLKRHMGTPSHISKAKPSHAASPTRYSSSQTESLPMPIHESRSPKKSSTVPHLSQAEGFISNPSISQPFAPTAVWSSSPLLSGLDNSRTSRPWTALSINRSMSRSPMLRSHALMGSSLQKVGGVQQSEKSAEDNANHTSTPASSTALARETGASRAIDHDQSVSSSTQMVSGPRSSVPSAISTPPSTTESQEPDHLELLQTTLSQLSRLLELKIEDLLYEEHSDDYDGNSVASDLWYGDSSRNFLDDGLLPLGDSRGLHNSPESGHRNRTCQGSSNGHAAPTTTVTDSLQGSTSSKGIGSKRSISQTRDDEGDANDERSPKRPETFLDSPPPIRVREQIRCIFDGCQGKDKHMSVLL